MRRENLSCTPKSLEDDMKALVLTTLLACSASALLAQQWQWPDNPKNLKVLPATTTGKELQQVMSGFTSGLGVRCDYCHVDEQGKGGRGFAGMDFASDTKPEKATARIMLTMVNAINSQYLAGLQQKKAASPVTVACVTCHHGTAVPMVLEDKLKQTFDASGIDSTLKQYRTLRDQYYGGFTYDFREGTLLRLADKIMADSTKTPAAIAVLKFNTEIYPSFAFTYVHLANIYEQMGNVSEAIASYNQAIKLNPGDERIKRQLERLEAKK
jgi:tetratricopeptide (TPR) repeat protein